MFNAPVQWSLIMSRYGFHTSEELDLLRQLHADQIEEFLERFFGALLTHPEQPRAARLDLVDQRQILMAATVGDFVHADGPDVTQLAMLQTPLHDIGDGLLDLLPAGVEGLCRLLP